MKKKELLEELGEKGYLLSGSRYFNRKFGGELITIGPSTDYDLYKQAEDGDEKYLQSLGFVLVNQKLKVDGLYVNDVKYPIDDLAVSIWEHDEYSIQVILRTDSELYSRVLDSITCEFYQTFLWKSSPTFIFQSESSIIKTHRVMQLMNQLFTMKA